MNLPNKITTMRLVIAIIIFILFSQVNISNVKDNSILLDIITVLFFIASLSDILDGYLARKYKMSTAFGRIADPLVDKVTVGGTFIFLMNITDMLYPWIVVLIISREFIVSGLRGYAESKGIAFPANRLGKIKMVIQCITAIGIMVYLSHLYTYEFAKILINIFIWTTVVITLISGAFYIIKAKIFFKEDNSI